MTGPVETWPDVEGALKDFLKADTGLVASPSAGRCTLALPNEPVYPLLTVLSISGSEGPGETPEELALIQIEVRGRVQQLSETNLVRLALRSALSKLGHGPVVIAGKATLLGAHVTDDRRFPMPGQQDGNGLIGERPRYIVTVQVFAVRG